VDFEAVSAVVKTMLAKGKTNSDCRKLGNASIQSVKTSVKALQNTIDDLPDGSNCKTPAQQKAVKDALKIKKKAEKTLKDAEKTHALAKKKKLTFTVTLDKMSDHKWWKQSSAYKTAVKARKQAKSKEEQAVGSLKTATVEYKKAVAAGKKVYKKCLCAAKSKHAAAMKKVKKAEKANKKDWRKAHLLLCVLDGTAEKKCAVPATPAVKAKLSKAAQDVKKCPAVSNGIIGKFGSYGDYEFKFVPTLQKFKNLSDGSSKAKKGKWLMETCATVGMKPICDEPGQCGKPGQSYFIGARTYYKFTNYNKRSKSSTLPGNWAKIKSKFNVKNLCYWDWGSNHINRAVCTGPTATKQASNCFNLQGYEKGSCMESALGGTHFYIADQKVACAKKLK